MKKWRCSVCGYIHDGDEPPETCPVCGADKSLFEEIIEEAPAEQQDSQKPEEKATPVSGISKDMDLGPEPKTVFGRIYRFKIQMMLKHHAHPVSVHIPNGVLPISFALMILSTLTGATSLATAAHINMVFVVLTLPFVLFSGYIEWQKRYKGLRSSRFITKIICACIVTVTSVLLVLWWVIDPGILQTSSLARSAFLFISLIMLAAAVVAGLIGGKLVFRD
ncbi:rubredoxin [Desulfobacterales bacterium]|nr:rubredoxin [Desulfobacterales bacterium]